MLTDIYPCLGPLSRRIKCTPAFGCHLTLLLVVLQAEAFPRLNQFQVSATGSVQFPGSLLLARGCTNPLSPYKPCVETRVKCHPQPRAEEHSPTCSVLPTSAHLSQATVLLLWLSLLHRKAPVDRCMHCKSVHSFYTTIKLITSNIHSGTFYSRHKIDLSTLDKQTYFVCLTM